MIFLGPRKRVSSNDPGVHLARRQYHPTKATTKGVLGRVHKALRSGGGFHRRLRSLKRQNGTNENEVDTEVHDFSFKLKTCKCQELHAPEKQPSRCMRVRNRKNTEKEQCCILEHILMILEIKAYPRASQAGASGCIFCRAEFDFFVRFENATSFKSVNALRHAGSRLSPTLSACLRCRAVIRRVLVLLFFAGLIALCCTSFVLAVDARQHARAYHMNKRPKW